MAYTTNLKLLNAVAISSVSPGAVVGDRTKMSFQFVNTTATVGIAKVQIQISNDGSNYVTYNRLISNNAAGTVFTTVNLDAAGNNKAFVFFPVGDVFEYVRVIYSRNNSDGTLTATLENVVPGF